MEQRTPESYGGLTDADIQELKEGLPPALQFEVERGAEIFNMVLDFSRNTRHWKELVDARRPVDLVLGDRGALDSEGKPDPTSALLARDPRFPLRLGSALARFSGVLRLARATPEALISDAVQQLAMKRAQTKVSRRAASSRRLDATARSAELRKFVQDVLGQLKTDVNERSIRWLVVQIQVAWCARQAADATPPSRGSLTPLLRALLPEHPILNPKK